MKRTVSILLSLVLLALLCSCGGSSGKPQVNAKYIYFQNNTDETIKSFYISAPTSDTWGEQLNAADVVTGGNIRIDPDKLSEGAGAVYDICAKDKTGRTYEIQEVPINKGDTILLSAEGRDVKATIRDKKGESTVYQGWSYSD